jgi:hypothetical protein
MNLNKSIEFFYKNVMDTSSEDDSGHDWDLLAVATLIHQHNKLQRHVHLGSTRPHRSMSIAIEKLATIDCTNTTSTKPIQSTRSYHFNAAIGCQICVLENYGRHEDAWMWTCR